MKETLPPTQPQAPEETPSPAHTRWSETREILQRALQEWDATKPCEKSPSLPPPQREKLEELFQQLQDKLKDLSKA